VASFTRCCTSFCHHLDREGLGFLETPHTRGFPRPRRRPLPSGAGDASRTTPPPGGGSAWAAPGASTGRGCGPAGPREEKRGELTAEPGKDKRRIVLDRELFSILESGGAAGATRDVHPWGPSSPRGLRSMLFAPNPLDSFLALLSSRSRPPRTRPSRLPTAAPSKGKLDLPGRDRDQEDRRDKDNEVCGAIREEPLIVVGARQRGAGTRSSTSRTSRREGAATGRQEARDQQPQVPVRAARAGGPGGIDRHRQTPTPSCTTRTASSASRPSSTSAADGGMRSRSRFKKPGFRSSATTHGWMLADLRVRASVLRGDQEGRHLLHSGTSPGS